MLRDLFARLIRKSGLDLHKANRYPVGRVPFRDAAYILGNQPNLCIFDVGANVGQTLEEIRERWSDARVHCFEPSPRAFAELERRAKGWPGVKLNPFALGSAPSEQAFREAESPALSSFLVGGTDNSSSATATLQMRIETLDAYCVRESIDHIDVLKTDTQGFDLEVLKGAGEMIGGGKVTMILVEITFADYYTGQATAGELIDHLTTHGYLPVCFYPMHYTQGQGHWIDGLFLHRSRTIPG